MPNGRSGGFIIERADLQQLVKTVPDATVVARIMVGHGPLRSADAIEIARFVAECPIDRIAVEEQDHNAYIIHLRNEPELIWVLVLSEMPIFPELRDRHRRWAEEHPGWNGWLGF